MYFVWFNLLNFYHLGFNELFKYHMIYIYERSISQKKREREENKTHKKKTHFLQLNLKFLSFDLRIVHLLTDICGSVQPLQVVVSIMRLKYYSLVYIKIHKIHFHIILNLFYYSLSSVLSW